VIIVDKYNKGTILFHWIHGALLMFVLLTASLVLSNLPDDVEKIPSLQIHLILGIVVVVLTIIRLIVLNKNEKLKPLKMDTFRQTIVTWHHRLIYILIFLIGVSGIISAKSANLGAIVFFGSKEKLYEVVAQYGDIFFTIHGILAKILLFLIVTHIAGVIFYIIKNKDNILKRIWF
jgi:cytochrome b561